MQLAHFHLKSKYESANFLIKSYEITSGWCGALSFSVFFFKFFLPLTFSPFFPSLIPHLSILFFSSFFFFYPNGILTCKIKRGKKTNVSFSNLRNLHFLSPRLFRRGGGGREGERSTAVRISERKTIWWNRKKRIAKCCSNIDHKFWRNCCTKGNWPKMISLLLTLGRDLSTTHLKIYARESRWTDRNSVESWDISVNISLSWKK